MPRATTAACEVLPPRAVRMPSAAIIPCTSSGLVSIRTRMTFSPCFAISSARPASKTALPYAAPGEAASPVAMISTLAAGSMRRWSSWSTCDGSTRRTASWRVISRSRAMSTAIFTAAAAVRLALRVCSM